MKEIQQRFVWQGFAWARGVAVAGSLALVLMAGCTSHPSDEQVKQQAADTTAQVKQRAQQAASDARVAAANAEDKINAVAAGVKQGMQSGSTGPTVDLNTANRDQLVTLPGITSAKARKIIDGRPYSASSDLVSKNVLTQGQYDRISSRVKAGG